MKKLIILIPIAFVILLSSCVFETKKSTEENEVAFSKTELLGEWVQTNKDIKGLEIKKINFKEDNTVIVEFLKPEGSTTATGKWKIGDKQELDLNIVKIPYESNIVVTIDSDDNHRQIIMFAVEEMSNKKILKGNDYQFEKE